MKVPNTNQYIGKRVTATLIDYTLVFGLSIAYVYLFGTPNEEGGYTVSGLAALVPMVFWFLYFVIAEALLDGTFGHQLLKLKVVSINNEPLSFGQVFLRRISDALEIAWCFGLIAFILAKNTQHNQRLGDIWAKTLVIGKNEPFPYDDHFDFETR
jgi:uncharacterized RDD family membrane protein YckC